MYSFVIMSILVTPTTEMTTFGDTATNSKPYVIANQITADTHLHALCTPCTLFFTSLVILVDMNPCLSLVKIVISECLKVEGKDPLSKHFSKVEKKIIHNRKESAAKTGSERSLPLCP